MKIEEAIIILKQFKNILKSGDCYESVQEAIYVVINEIESNQKEVKYLKGCIKIYLENKEDN